MRYDTPPIGVLASAALLGGLAVHAGTDPTVEGLRLLLERAAAVAARAAVEQPDVLEVLSVRFGGADPVSSPVTDVELIDVDGPNQSGMIRLRFRLKSGDRPLGAARVTVRGIVRGPVLVAKRTLIHGQPIALDAVERVEAELTRLGGEPLRDIAELAGQVPVRSLGAGRPLTADLLRPQPVVRRGQAVELKIRRGGLTVTARGTAVRDGAPGETVPAENLATGARVLGRVMEDGTLLVVQGARPARRR